MLLTDNPSKSKQGRLLLVVFLLLIAAVSSVWFIFTPAGILAKLNAVAYSVCHQNPDHTLVIGSRLLPLCARCTGMFLGSLIGMTFLSRGQKQAGYPTRKMQWVLGGLILFFIIDGINSGLFTLLNGLSLYPPGNPLQLISGMGMGLVLASLIIPIWRQTMRIDPDPQPGFYAWRQFLVIALIYALVTILILSAPDWLFFPVAILSTLTIPFLLSMVYTLLWILMLKRENSFRNWKEIFPYISLGCLTAFIQIAAFDLIRFLITETWAGIQF